MLTRNYNHCHYSNHATCNGVSAPPRSNSLGIDGIITNDPNPFTSSTKISFRTAGGHTLIQVIDTMGRLIKALLERDYTAPAQDFVDFNAEGLPNGIYYARFQNGVVQKVRPMLKVR
jgi:hypothetical protein